MPAITGDEYLHGCARRRARSGSTANASRDVTTHPATRHGARSLAHLYDMQHDPALRDTMTYVSPTSGERVGMSFLRPQTIEDLRRRSAMMKPGRATPAA